MRHRSYEIYIIKGVKKICIVFVGAEGEKENMRGDSTLGVEVSEDLPEITEQKELAVQKGEKMHSGGIVCAKVQKLKTGVLRG